MSSPDQRRLEADLNGPDFQAGVASGAWALVALRWPIAVFELKAGDGQSLQIRVDVEGYPAVAPAGQPWDPAADAPLAQERWPQFGAETRPFRRDWSPPNGNAPYIAADRIPLASHPTWPLEHPERAWHPGRTIAFYLAEVVRELRGTVTPSAVS